MTFPTRLRRALRYTGHSRAEAAALLGIANSTLEKWLNSRVTPHPLAQEGAIRRLIDHSALATLRAAHTTIGDLIASLDPPTDPPQDSPPDP